MGLEKPHLLSATVISVNDSFRTGRNLKSA